MVHVEYRKLAFLHRIAHLAALTQGSQAASALWKEQVCSTLLLAPSAFG